MDGVLFDTESLCKRAWSQVAAERGIRDMEEVSLRCIGLNANDTRALVLNHYGQDFPYDEFRGKVSEWMEDTMQREGVPVKCGARELLDFLENAGCRVGLASSSRRAVVESHLERTGLRPFFSVIVTGDMVEHSKPLPDIYLLACDRLGARPEEVFAIEDSPNGIRSAYAAGMKALMVPDLLAPDGETRQLSYRIFGNLLEVRDYLETEWS